MMKNKKKILLMEIKYKSKNFQKFNFLSKIYLKSLKSKICQCNKKILNIKIISKDHKLM